MLEVRDGQAVPQHGQQGAVVRMSEPTKLPSGMSAGVMTYRYIGGRHAMTEWTAWLSTDQTQKRFVLEI